jgi:diamine N-acetyltransferase
MLSNSIITLRAIEPQDLDFLYHCENHKPLWAHGSNKEPVSYFTLKKYVNIWNKTIYDTKQMRLMVVFNEQKNTIGVVDLYDFDYFNSRVGVGIYIDEKYQNKGFGTIVIQLLTDYAFNFLNIHQIYAFVLANNAQSAKIFTKTGFELSATLKDWEKSSKNFYDIKIFTKINK